MHNIPNKPRIAVIVKGSCTMKANQKTALNGFTGNLVVSPVSTHYLAENKVWLHFTIEHQAGSAKLPFEEIITVLDNAGHHDWESVINAVLTYQDGVLVGWEVVA